MPCGPRARNLYPRFGAFPHAPRAAHPHIARSLQGYYTCSESRAPLNCAPTPGLSRMLREPRTLELHTQLFLSTKFRTRVKHMTTLACS